MANVETIDMLVEGGHAKPGPTTAPKLGMLKVNIAQLFKEINERTKDYEGMNVPVKVIVNREDGSYSIKIGTPPVSSLIKKELGLKKLAPEEEEKEEETTNDSKKKKKAAMKEKQKKGKKRKVERVIVGNLSMEQCIKIMRMKRHSLLAKTSRGALKEIVSSCVSMPITIESKPPKEILKEIEEGKWDHLLG